MAHPWPGNVRELKMEIKRAYYLADEGGLIQSTHLSEEVRGAESRPGTAPKGPLAAERRSAVERAVRGALRDAGGRVTAAAEALGITRQALSRHMRLLGIRSQEYHPREG
jgi:two-component system response regulator HupR/HoxA